MRRYETIFIADPDIPEESRVQLFEKTKNLIEEQKGTLLEFDDWGNKRLAYEVKKKVRGYYVRLDYCGDGKLVDELERSFRIDDRVMKYLTVLLNKDADLEAILNVMAEEKAESEAPKEADIEESQKVEAESEEPKEADIQKEQRLESENIKKETTEEE